MPFDPENPIQPELMEPQSGFTPEETQKGKSFFDLERVKESVRRTLWSGMRPSNEAVNRPYLFQTLRQQEDLFEGKEQEYLQKVAELEAMGFGTAEEMVSVISAALIEFASANFSNGQLGRALLKRDRQEKYIRINEVLTYGGDKDVIHIHIDPIPGHSDSVPIRERSNFTMQKIREGLQALAHIISEEHKWKDVRSVTATSELVAKHPEKLQELGFDVKGDVSEELRNLYFSDSPKTKKIWLAEMTREKFLNEYKKINP